MKRLLLLLVLLPLGCGPNKSMQKGDKVFDTFVTSTSTAEHVQIATPGGASKTVTLPRKEPSKK